VREYVLTLLVAAAVTYILTPLVRRIAIKAGAMHEARDRDVHVVPIPRLGGLAMYAGLVGGLLVAGQMKPLNSVFTGPGTLSTQTGLLLAGGLIVAMGAVDDRWGMSPISKLAGQVAAGAILIASGCEIGWLPLPGGGTFSPSPDQAIVLTILVVVATINAVNFIDGLDGLAAGIVAIAAVSFFLYYYSLTKVLGISAEGTSALVSAVLAGMCLGFLPHNFYPARIFMGDTGSMLLGLLLAYAPISSISALDPRTLTSGHAYHLGTVNRFPELLPLLVPAAILVIPYADMLMAVFRRTRAGKSPFAPDRRHLHHRLLDIGRSHRASVIVMYLWAALFSTAIVVLSIVGRPTWVFAAITVGAILLLLLMSMPRLRWWNRRQRPALARAAEQPPTSSLVTAASPAVPVSAGAPRASAGAGAPPASPLRAGGGAPPMHGATAPPASPLRGHGAAQPGPPLPVDSGPPTIPPRPGGGIPPVPGSAAPPTSPLPAGGGAPPVRGSTAPPTSPLPTSGGTQPPASSGLPVNPLRSHGAPPPVSSGVPPTNQFPAGGSTPPVPGSSAQPANQFPAGGSTPPVRGSSAQPANQFPAGGSTRPVPGSSAQPANQFPAGGSTPPVPGSSAQPANQFPAGGGIPPVPGHAAPPTSPLPSGGGSMPGRRRRSPDSAADSHDPEAATSSAPAARPARSRARKPARPDPLDTSQPLPDAIAPRPSRRSRSASGRPTPPSDDSAPWTSPAPADSAEPLSDWRPTATPPASADPTGPWTSPDPAAHANGAASWAAENGTSHSADGDVWFRPDRSNGAAPSADAAWPAAENGSHGSGLWSGTGNGRAGDPLPPLPTPDQASDPDDPERPRSVVGFVPPAVDPDPLRLPAPADEDWPPNTRRS
jgi:UDP-GlcNAc:undecaprenyl-phosphate GlcNAc-1-phosphate transferase